MKLTAVFLTIAGVLMASACSRDLSTDPETVKMRALTQNEQRVTKASDKFGLELFVRVVQDEKEANIFISPLSVSMALGMTLNGANGETESVMRQTLGFDNMSAEEINRAYQSLIELLTTIDPKVKFEIANSIWSRSDFQVEAEFKNTNATYFNALVSPLDFGSASAPKTINNWVDDKTHGKIDKIVDQIPPQTVMYVINAIYFKGTWTLEFDKSATRDETFFITETERVQVPFMHQKSQNFAYLENDLMQAIDLPYGNEHFRMTLLLPHNDKSVDDILARLNSTNWASWMGSLTNQPGTLQMPKFKIEYKKSLPGILSAMGMSIAFSRQADFTGINKDGNLFISDVLHKTFVDVDEEGTEAAAATSVAISLTSVGGPSGFFMRIDRPFIFCIREKSSGTILFIGKIIDPR
ncbi:serpin family protein [candidate division KSB1 bacterium]|nr:serpin family protein [candidate division KSB1 bacterium]RQW05663.1 MAG: serpin family protein [candidate division KSB1 bacterium]